MTELLTASDVVVDFRLRGRAKVFRALDGVSITVGAGQTVGLVGESGSGKTTLGRSILGLVKPTSGSILFQGEEIVGASRRRRKELSRAIQVVFQDPYSSLDPTMPIGETLIEPYLAHRLGSRRDALAKAARLVDQVNLPSSTLERLPREFSGGQRQRIAIARAMMVDPALVVCDEPVSALDVSTQSQVIELFRSIQRETGVAYLFISHDLALVRQISDRVSVIYRGNIVEEGDPDVLGESPRDEYTKRLLLSVPVPDPRLQRERREARRALLDEERALELSDR
jgi:ABC-type glutathione transport system ATPase component